MKVTYKQIQPGTIIQLGRMTKDVNKSASGRKATVVRKWANTQEQSIQVRLKGNLPRGQERELIVTPYNVSAVLA